MGFFFRYSLIFSCIYFFCLDGYTQKYAPKDIYLVDSLDLRQVTSEDKEFLDSCLSIYHNTTQDTVKITILDLICDRLFLKNPDWRQFQFFMLQIIEDGLKKNLTKKEYYFLKKSQSQALNDIAGIYQKDGNISKTLSHFFKAIKGFEEIGDSILIAMVNNNIGTLCHEMRSYDLAMKYYSKSLEISIKSNFDHGKSITLGLIAGTYIKQEKYSEALRFSKKSLFFYRQLVNRRGEAIILYQIANTLFFQGKLNEALEALNKSFNICNDIQFTGKIADIQHLKVKILLEKKEIDGAFNTAVHGLKMAQKAQHIRRVEGLAKQLYPLYERRGDTEKAYEAFKLYVGARDKTFNKKNAILLNRLETKHKIQEKNNRIQLLDKENRLKTGHLQLTVVISAFFLLALFTGGLILMRIKRKKYEQELQTLRELQSESEQNKSAVKLSSIPVTIGKKIVTIDFDDIAFFKAQSNFVFLNTHLGRSYIVDYSLSALEKNLPDIFFRVHRSFIINKSYIKEIKKTTRRRVILTMNDKSNSNIPSGMVYSDQVQNLIKGLGH